MKTRNKVKFSIILFLVQAVMFVFVGCSKETIPNQKLGIDVNVTTENLKVTITGSITDTDGLISEAIIDWGDSHTENIATGDFIGFEKSHIYSQAASYNVSLTAIDNNGDSTGKSLNVVVEYKEVDIGNIKDGLFKTSNGEYLILTINLHTYQEDQQNEKLNMLMEVIGKMDVDFIALQECAQHKSATITEGIIREDNMALVIANSLKDKYNIEYNFVWDWAHYGWSVWEEGVAVLSKHPLINSEDKYVSTNTSNNNITSRKVIYGSYQIPEGRVNIFSAHTHWRTSETDEEQNNQINNIQLMVDEKEALAPVEASFVCGDFNGNPTSDYPWSEGYNTMINNGGYVDTFLEIYPDANNKPAQSIYNTVGGTYPGRIDYIFTKNNAHFRVVDSQIIFTNDVVGKISDHFGVITKVEYIQ